VITRNLILVCLALASAGCTNLNTKTQQFLASLPALDVQGAKQSITNPAFTDVITATGITTDPTTGVMTIATLDATLTVPDIGLQSSTTLTGLKIQATAEQLRQAADLIDRKRAAAAGVAQPK
jgi:hypothetical protein